MFIAPVLEYLFTDLGEGTMANATVENVPEEPQDEITVATSRFGEISVRADKIITMTSPFLGFPESKRFILRPHSAESPFMWLQSLENPKLAFVVIQAAPLVPHYRPAIAKHILQELEISQNQQPEILLILTVPSGRPEKMTANLLAPLAINAQRRLAKQVLLDPTTYDPCWPVFTDEKEES